MQTCQVPLMQLVACDKNVHIYVDGKSGCVACIYEQLNIRNLYGTVFHVMPIFFVPHAHIHNKFNLFYKVARKSKLVSLILGGCRTAARGSRSKFAHTVFPDRGLFQAQRRGLASGPKTAHAVACGAIEQ